MWAARELAELGYRDTASQLGLPFGTAVSKGKGSGFLRNLHELEVYCADARDALRCPSRSNTRAWVCRTIPSNERILEPASSLPLAELIVIACANNIRYQGKPRLAVWRVRSRVHPSRRPDRTDMEAHPRTV